MRLIDQLHDLSAHSIQSPTKELHRVLNTAYDSVKFIVGKEYAAACDELSHDTQQLERVLSYCKLPYETCWFEYRHHDRTSFIGGKSPAKDEATPTRVGMLCEALDGSLAKYRLTLIWTFYGSTDSSNDIDALTKVGITAQWEISRLRVLVDTTKPTIEEAISLDWLMVTNNAESELFYASKSSTDWAGEMLYVLALLALLNSTNAVEQEPSDLVKINKRRNKAGKLPLHEYHVLKLRPTVSNAAHAGEACGEKQPLRAHFVRGHFKVRRTGIFWWHPHIRGDVTRGFADKDYVLEGRRK